MPRSTKTQIRYGKGTINPLPNGHFSCFLFDPHTRKRHRSHQPTIDQARAWIEMTENATAANRPPLTRVQLADAAHALTVIPPGFTLTDAARALAETHTPSTADLPLTEALDRFIDAKEISTAQITRTAYRQSVERFARHVGEITAGSVTTDQIKDFLVGMKAVSRNSVLRNLAAFFHWCQAEGIIRTAPTDRVGKAKESKPPKGILKIAEAKALLAAAVKVGPEMIPYIALSLFAGMRPEELARFTPQKIGSSFIMIDEEVAKTNDTRTIRIRPNLRAWLTKFPPKTFPTKTERRRPMDKIIKKADIKWKHDCMRHSFATYAYEETKDAAVVSSEMGHVGTAVFFKHYRAMSHPGDGRKFFNIRPKLDKSFPTKFQRKP
jgi:site-specific recombinase XerD